MTALNEFHTRQLFLHQLTALGVHLNLADFQHSGNNCIAYWQTVLTVLLIE